MYLKILSLVVITLTGIAACTKTHDRTYYLKVDSIRNLTEESKVYCKNVSIGRVTDLQLLPSLQVIIEVQIEGSFLPVRKDTFAIVDYDYFGSQVVELIPSRTRDDPYEEGDTISSIILLKEPLMQLDSATRKVAIDSLLTPFIRKN